MYVYNLSWTVYLEQHIAILSQPQNTLTTKTGGLIDNSTEFMITCDTQSILVPF